MDKVDNAIILAAGLGERAAPLSYETPKGLFKVHGTPMVERLIRQLREKNITEIIIVVGYMKEKFDYLIDKYGVELVYNPEFATKNNLASLYRVKNRLRASYLLMSDNYIEQNIFSEYECESWFSCPFYKGYTEEWIVSKASDAGVIEQIEIGGRGAYAIQGPAYFSPEFSRLFCEHLEDYYGKPASRDYYWEHILKDEIHCLPPMKIKDTTANVHEFENMEELREYDKSYFEETNNKIMQTIARVFNASQGDIHSIEVIKEGMNNRSFKFTLGDKSYVFRLSGASTSMLVDRVVEKESYEKLKECHLTDEVVYFDEKSGIKISVYLEESQNANPFDDVDLRLSMQTLSLVHAHKMKVSKRYDIKNKTKYFLQLANEVNAIRFSDFDEVMERIQELYRVQEKLTVDEILCHGDFAHVNTLMLPNHDARIIDWEFSGNGDPIMDVAMYAIFAEFDHGRIDLSLQYYLGRQATPHEQLRLYLYVSLSAFLWTVWAEYKQATGSEFGDYPLKMYRYAKEYYKICVNHPIFRQMNDGKVDMADI